MASVGHSLLCVGGPADGQRRLVTSGGTLTLEYHLDGHPRLFEYHRLGYFVDGMRIDLWVYGEPGLAMIGAAIALERQRATELGLLIVDHEPSSKPVARG
jgi:hypothetical protein